MGNALSVVCGTLKLRSLNATKCARPAGRDRKGTLRSAPAQLGGTAKEGQVTVTIVTGTGQPFATGTAA